MPFGWGANPNEKDDMKADWTTEVTNAFRLGG